MKLAQFKKKDSAAHRLGLGSGERIVDIAALAQAVKSTGEEVAGWLLETNSTRDVIGRGAAALADIKALIDAAHAPGLAQDERFSLSAAEIEFCRRFIPERFWPLVGTMKTMRLKVVALRPNRR